MTEFEGSSEAAPTAVPSAWVSSSRKPAAFLEALAEAPVPLLICDYDGTLAPFQEDKMEAVPYPGVAERLAAIAQGRTRIAFVSGRPVEELVHLLPLAAEAEIWGMHGREHRMPNGAIRRLEPTAPQRAALDAAEANLRAFDPALLVERKTASVALHWRTMEAYPEQARRLHEVQAFARETLTPYAGQQALSLLPFDGGLELRAEDHTKGHATAALLSGAGIDPRPAAFLGDDTTDEDAFRVMQSQGGIGLLVREPPRPSYAHFSLKPPEELLAFLDTWLSMVASAGINA